MSPGGGVGGSAPDRSPRSPVTPVPRNPAPPARSENNRRVKPRGLTSGAGVPRACPEGMRGRSCSQEHQNKTERSLEQSRRACPRSHSPPWRGGAKRRGGSVPRPRHCEPRGLPRPEAPAIQVCWGKWKRNGMVIYFLASSRHATLAVPRNDGERTDITSGNYPRSSVRFVLRSHERCPRLPAGKHRGTTAPPGAPPKRHGPTVFASRWRRGERGHGGYGQGRCPRHPRQGTLPPGPP